MSVGIMMVVIRGERVEKVLRNPPQLPNQPSFRFSGRLVVKGLRNEYPPPTPP